MPEEVRPGIYRTTIGHPYGPPGLKRHLEWCRKNSRRPEDHQMYPVSTLLNQILTEHQQAESEPPKFFPTPFDFLTAWKTGYDKGQPDIDRLRFCFELQFVTWDENNPYYKTGDWGGVNQFGQLDGILIASDLNGLYDLDGFVNFVVNDFQRKQVLVYRPFEQISARNRKRWKENTLLEDEPPYTELHTNLLKFPFTSLNPLKSRQWTWSAVGFSPRQIYDAIKQVGFVFPA